jgi:hypothetical protein
VAVHGWPCHSAEIGQSDPKRRRRAKLMNATPIPRVPSVSLPSRSYPPGTIADAVSEDGKRTYRITDFQRSSEQPKLFTFRSQLLREEARR